MVNAVHKSYGGGAKELMSRLKRLSSQKVCVGVPAAKNERDQSEIGNADLVYIHTHGVRPSPVREEMQKEINKGTRYSAALQMYLHEHGSFTHQVPARPIIEPAIEKSKEPIAELLGGAAKHAARGEDIRQTLNDVGQYAQNKVQNYFTDPSNGWPENSSETVKKKRSDKPLIDTGALRQSITFVIRGDGDD